MSRKFLPVLLSILLLAAVLPVAAQADAGKTPPRRVRLKDVATIQGVRDNLLIGYGLVVGLNRTGDTQQTFFATQTLANALQRMGLQIPVASVQVRNVAGVFVTAVLPPFARPGMKIDVTASSVGDAKSLQGGVLLLTPLHSSDGQVYATAEGPLAIAGYTAGSHGNLTQVNHPTVGRIPNGGIVERDDAIDLSHMDHISFLLDNPDFDAAAGAASAINEIVHRDVAHAVDATRINVSLAGLAPDAIPGFVGEISDATLVVSPPAKVVINERTGTIVLGADVSLGPCSIIQGSLEVQISTKYEVSQPEPFSKGQTTVVPQTNVEAQEEPAKAVQLNQGATVDDLVRGLQSIGATAKDIVAVLQAIKAAGALQADLEVI
ncbi:MAG TPA: flagellar basal body P-ring protein FlgI [Candidatus Aquilonibacter sp.]|nr:flagellar basal body P-ring protein FlgI [Candidatus Aquilonibacter sp.]